jgi:hypothetical protein
MRRVLKRGFLVITGIVIVLFLINLIRPQLLANGYNYFFSDIVKVKCLDYKQAAFSRRLNNKIPDYIEISASTGIKKCKDKKEILERVSQGKLFEIEKDKGFIIENMSHSYPYLTKEGKELLEELGERFREKISGTRLKGSRFTVTSMTRTTDKLKILREINSNTSMNSPHLYGNAFDLSYLRFSTRKLFLTYCDKKYLKEALAEVIWKLREEKKCWATYEVKQNCYHVVAR